MPAFPSLTAHIEENLLRHSAAVAWRDFLGAPASVAWIDGDIGVSHLALLSGAERDRLEPLLETDDAVLRRRVLSAIHDRLALRFCVAQIQNPRSEIQNPALSHTPLGQPMVTGLADTHVSFTHDGEAHLCLLAQHADLRGVGIDAVHLPRLRGRSDAYLRRFAGHFMSEEEFACFAAQNETGEALMLRAAAHFSLMESASKALGTGLKIGAGMGKPQSLPKQALGVARVAPDVEFLLGPEARVRCEELGAGCLEGHWATDGEYGVSAVLLWR